MKLKRERERDRAVLALWLVEYLKLESPGPFSSKDSSSRMKLLHKIIIIIINK